MEKKHSHHDGHHMHEGRSVKNRTPDWGKDMKYGMPQKCDLKQWPRYDGESSDDYARAGYNNTQERVANDRMNKEGLELKGMYV